jgi:hypothetical protein
MTLPEATSAARAAGLSQVADWLDLLWQQLCQEKDYAARLADDRDAPRLVALIIAAEPLLNRAIVNALPSELAVWRRLREDLLQAARALGRQG